MNILWLLYVSLFLTNNAYAKRVCGSIRECEDLIGAAHSAIQELSARVSNMGVIFVRDTSNAALGEAYRDPDGLIWGSIVKAQGQTETTYQLRVMSYREAADFCQIGGARLPTEREFHRLAKYFGYYSPRGYSPYLEGTNKDVIPGISRYWFWSSSSYKKTELNGFFDGGYGAWAYADRKYNLAAICVDDHLVNKK